MIVNDEDLLPLTPSAASKSQTVQIKQDDFGIFGSQLAEADDSIALLLAARAEAEEAEARAQAAGETKLPYAKNGKGTQNAQSGVGINFTPTFSTNLGEAKDEDSPAPIHAFGGDLLARLSDATAEQATSIKDFMNEGPASGAQETISLPPLTPQTALHDDDLLGGQSNVNTNSIRPLSETHITELLRMTVQYGGSDLHLTVDLPPMIRKDGKLVPLAFSKAQERDTQRLVFDVLNNEQIEKFERHHELDFSYGLKGVGRFRFNVYRQRSTVGCAMRVIPNRVPSMDELKLPAVMREFTRKHSGLVLVTGPTGSGKSTTIASMIDIINTERECHILTIEDPIEYLHMHKKSMVNQRELGADTDSFNNALRASLREDPDVILVGEMRDLETIAAAITLAETGHLVFATLHTRSAPATIDRIVDVFPSHQQDQVRIQLSTSIEAVVAQQLLPKIGGGRVAAIEIMVATSALRNLIREGKTYQITSVIETGHQYGMQAMDRVLADLHRSGQVTYEEAATRSIDRENFMRLVKGY